MKQEQRRGPLISEILPSSHSNNSGGLHALLDGNGGDQTKAVAGFGRRCTTVAQNGGIEGINEATGVTGEEEKEHKKGTERSVRSGGRAGRGLTGGYRPAVKAGFLERVGKGKTSPLYPPEGSENGAEPGCYAKLMGRCKVVDTSSASKEEVILLYDHGQ